MKNLFITLVSAFITFTTFAQEGKPYGPIAYRAPKETIGEDYYVMKVDTSRANLGDGYVRLQKVVNGKSVDIKENLEGKIIKLIEVNGDIGLFKDSEGIEYNSKISDELSFFDLIPVKEFEDTKALLLNKPLWVNNPHMQIGNWETRNWPITAFRFEKVMITNVKYGSMAAWPIKITLKTADGEIGDTYISLSGTNTGLDMDHHWFSKNFFTTDPHLLYKFTPQVWKQIENYQTPIGMPTDAVVLMKGLPESINKTTDKTGTTYQYVFGKVSPSYYYFKNGKLVLKQE